jgi:hypothetical protein
MEHMHIHGSSQRASQALRHAALIGQARKKDEYVANGMLGQGFTNGRWHQSHQSIGGSVAGCYPTGGQIMGADRMLKARATDYRRPKPSAQTLGFQRGTHK